MSMDTTKTPSRYEIAGGTVAGRSHALAGKPNQDAYAWEARGDLLAAVVCDGCGSSPHSEIGARIGARIAVASLLARLEEGAAPGDAALWDGLGRDLLGSLRDLTAAMGGRPAETARDHFLFTVIGVALSGDRGAVFAAGDGVVAVDGEVTRLGPFPGNEPPYLAYGLLSSAAPGLCPVRIFSGARTVLLGTDGAGDLADLRVFWEDDRWFQNQDALRRRLAQQSRDVTRPLWDERRIVREPGRLDDDTTLVVVRRRG